MILDTRRKLLEHIINNHLFLISDMVFWLPSHSFGFLKMLLANITFSFYPIKVEEK